MVETFVKQNISNKNSSLLLDNATFFDDEIQLV